MTLLAEQPVAVPEEPEPRPSGLVGWITTTDHKRIGIMTIAVAFVVFLAMGCLAITMRTQLAQPDQRLVDPHEYAQLFTIHGSGMIFLAITPFAIGLGVYLVPLQVGAPNIAGPRLTAFGFWLYIAGGMTIFSGFLGNGGGADAGWYAYTPLSDGSYAPGPGESLWAAGAFLTAVGMILMSSTMLWTALRLRAPGMTLLRMPVFTWSEIVTCMMVIPAFPSLAAAMAFLCAGRMDPAIFNSHDAMNLLYENLFWFYGHPVVYVMFFPFVGCVAEVLATFAHRRYVGYTYTVVALMAFAAGSMSVWGHHLFNSGQVANDYFSLTSIFLSIPAGIEYFGELGTILAGSLVYPTPMLFALAFIPQFLVGGLTGIMVAFPVLDYHFNDSYFIVGHFHYTLFCGSVFGFFAGLYFWWPKATGWMLSDRLGKVHFWLMTIGANVTFLPFFVLGFKGLPRRVFTYQPGFGFGTWSLIATIGSFIIGISVFVFLVNVFLSARRRVPAPGDPWEGQTLEWSTSSPPPQFNYSAIPPIHSFAPLLDLRLEEAEALLETDGAGVDGHRPPEDRAGLVES